ncbi:hypothetical protein [Streptomyces sp. B5E4]|uniref:hypothetical protein n=1 Tax=Streptomyces sp. B5E4 TaxID=3153568 RepID=UPI00325EF770
MGNRSTATLVAVLAAGTLLAGPGGLPGPSAAQAAPAVDPRLDSVLRTDPTALR